MPLIRTSASDVTAYRRVSATNLPTPNIRSAGYSAPLRNIIGSIARASAASAGASPGNTVLLVYGAVVPPTPPTPPPTAITGSLYFDAQYIGTSPDPVGAFISVNNPISDLSPGMGNFTVEWWQYLSTNGYKERPFVFMLGTNTFGFFLEGLAGVRTPTVVVNGLSLPAPGTVTVDDAWAHVAIVRSSGEIKIYVDGTFLAAFAYASTLVSGDPLVIGANSTTPMNNDVFEGNITNFRWIVGTAMYTSNFTPSLDNLPVTPQTKLLFLAASAPDYIKNTAFENYPEDIFDYGTQWSASVPP